MCSPVCESPSKSGFKIFIWLRFLSKSAIQYYAVTSVSQRDEGCAMRGSNTPPSTCFYHRHARSLQNWIRCLQMRNHTSLFWQFLVLTVDLVWIVNVIQRLKVHNLHRLTVWMFTELIRNRSEVSGNLTWTSMILQNKLKRFHIHFSFCLHTLLLQLIQDVRAESSVVGGNDWTDFVVVWRLNRGNTCT